MCSTPHLYEKNLLRNFKKFLNSLITDRAAITGSLKEPLMAIVDNTALEREHKELQEECEVELELMRMMVQENARIVQDQVEYKAKENSLAERYGKASTRLAEVDKDIAARSAKRSEFEGFLKLLDSREQLLTEFDESLWLGIVHQMKVKSETEFAFVLKDGREHIWNLERHRFSI